MGYSPGEFGGYAMGGWDDDIHWEHSSGMIRLWNFDEMMPLLVLMDETQARKCLSDLQLLVEMAWPR